MAVGGISASTKSPGISSVKIKVTTVSPNKIGIEIARRRKI
jgi:hypothetical protein